jgi:hypothetical protein
MRILVAKDHVAVPSFVAKGLEADTAKPSPAGRTQTNKLELRRETWSSGPSSGGVWPIRFASNSMSKNLVEPFVPPWHESCASQEPLDSDVKFRFDHDFEPQQEVKHYSL